MLLQNENRTLWKLGTLPPGLITYYSTTKPLDKSWHVLGLGYNPSISMDEIRNAAVVHFNGNMKPWLDIAMTQFKPLRSKYVDYELDFEIGKESIQKGPPSEGATVNSNTLSAGVESFSLGSGVATHIKSSGSDILAQDFQVVEQDDKLNEGNTGITLSVQLGFERSWVDEMRQRVVARDPAWTMHKHELLKFHLATLCDNWEYLLLIPISHLLPELEHLILNQNSRPVHVSVLR
ncbi:hypothetical protein JHK84_038875 [Glycine max]|nr:hypothetical protein JHK86_038651 [Glycine max]KAG5120535.1 hypothetical protein JHK84_038875 [Glycine max]